MRNRRDDKSCRGDLYFPARAKMISSWSILVKHDVYFEPCRQAIAWLACGQTELSIFIKSPCGEGSVQANVPKSFWRDEVDRVR